MYGRWPWAEVLSVSAPASAQGEEAKGDGVGGHITGGSRAFAETA